MLVLRLRPLAFATFLVWRLRIGACGVGACGFWRLWQLPVSLSTNSSCSWKIYLLGHWLLLWNWILCYSLADKAFCRPDWRMLCTSSWRWWEPCRASSLASWRTSSPLQSESDETLVRYRQPSVHAYVVGCLTCLSGRFSSQEAL